MYIVPIAWLYVAVMMAVVEANSTTGTLLGAIITFLLYGLMPVGLLVYLMSSPARKAARRAREAGVADETGAAAGAAGAVETTTAVDASASQKPVEAPAEKSGASLIQPDAGHHAPATAQCQAVSSVRKVI